MTGCVIDLYSGCGGFSLGAEQAGFIVSKAFDIDEDLHSSFHLNFPNTNAITTDVAALTKSFWSSNRIGSRVTAVIGGPPCQGFSRMGKGKTSDPRNQLVYHFFRNIRNIEPKFFVMENVCGILDAKHRPVLEAALEQLPGKYQLLGPLEVNAADFGAATNRKRILLVGYDPEELNRLGNSIFTQTKKPISTVKQAIFDLPGPLELGIGRDCYAWAKFKTDRISNYAKKARTPPKSTLGWNMSIDKLKGGITSGLRPTKHTEQVIGRFSETLPGKVEPTSRYPRLTWDGLAPTLRAGTGSDKGSFQAMRPIHPDEPRVITVREAARLQGFPDWFVFHPTKWHSFRMIGNSVSPYLSEAIMSNIRDSGFS